ncbi:MAG: metal ABC transporter ATP-binding protein [Clostridia bacterium]|nr:metal ABC transporter ATP-binding protein [Clostridia bacterium]
MSLLSCKNLSMSYDNNNALTDISFDVDNGDYLCIVGENGSGKSTLLKGLLGLMSPISGEILFGDNLKPNEIGYLPQQQSINRSFPASCFEVVLSGTLSKKGLIPFYNKHDKARALDAMQKLNILSLKNKSYKQLSGGQQQRVLLARALCATDKLLIVDEPTTGLDPLISSEFYKLIHKLNKLYGITIIMTSHDINSLTKYATKILHLKNNVQFIGTYDEYKNTEIGKTFLGGISHV